MNDLIPLLGISDIAVSLRDLLLNLGIGGVLAFFIMWHYNWFAASLSNRASFSRIFPVILLTTLLVISVVKSSLALSLGLVGALSIVRFRTPIKEPEELAYLFVTIAAGLGLGANQRVATVMSVLVILGIIAVFRLANRSQNEKDLYLELSMTDDLTQHGNVQEVQQFLSKHTTSCDLRRVDLIDREFHMTFFVQFANIESVGLLTHGIKEKWPGVSLTLIDQTRMPSV